MRKLLLLLFAITSFFAKAQPHFFEEWQNQEGTQHFFMKNVTRTDLNRNTYILGATLNGNGEHDIMISKYNRSGVLQWTQTYVGAGNGEDAGAALVTDSNGNVYVCGTSYSGTTTKNDAIVIKYNSSGVQQWVYLYNGPGDGDDGALDIVLDSNEEPVFAGTGYVDANYLHNIVTVKLDASGNEVWTDSYDYNLQQDGGHKISYDSSSDEITVGGGSQDSPTDWYYTVIVLDATSGGHNYITQSNPGSSSTDKITDLYRDNFGKIYVTGASYDALTGTGWNYYTMKLQNNLTVDWTATFNGSSNLDDVPTCIKADNSGNVYVTGFTTTSTEATNYATIKYNSSGVEQWVRYHNGKGNGADTATAMVINNNTGSVYVTGTSVNFTNNEDYYTIKYSSTGDTLAEINFNSINNHRDKALGIANDTIGEIIVTGQSWQNDSTSTYVTIRYVEKDVIFPPDTIPVSSAISFIENRGQLLSTDTLPFPQIKYYTNNTSPATYFMDTTLSYVFARIDTSSSTPDSLHRVDMKFAGSNDSKIYSLNLREEYTSYFLGHIPEGRANVPHYEKLMQFNVYNNIDVQYSSNSKGLKYYLIMKTGAETGEILMNYSGADSIATGTSGELIIYTSLGNIVQPKAKAFQIDGSGNHVALTWQPDYYINGNSVTFDNVGAYTSAQTLVFAVDWGESTPASAANANIQWSTYYGGTGSDFVWDSHVDVYNNIFVAGTTHSSTFPVSQGPLQGQNLGSKDCFVIKFMPNRGRQWGTYYGGNAEDEAYAITTDGQGNVFFTGNSRSTDFPKCTNCPGYYQGNLKGGRDAFMVKLNQWGTVKLWATYFGGNDHDFGYSIDYKSPYLYVAGYATTQASPFNLDFPTKSLPGAYNQSIHGDANSSSTSKVDVFVAKFLDNGTQEWTSFLGGSGIEQPTGCAVDENGNLFVSGHSNNSGYATCSPISGKFPVCDPGNGAYVATNAGDIDAFISKFDVNSALEWSTLYGGEWHDRAPGGTPGTNCIAVDRDGNIYVVGSTNSAYFPTYDVPGAFFQDTLNNQYSIYNGFILKFSNHGVRKWATLYGGVDDDIFLSVATDPDYNRTFVGGFTWTDSLLATMEHIGSTYYWQPNRDGVADAFLIVLNESDTLEWATYVGGSEFEYIKSINAFSASSGQTGLITAGWSLSANYPVEDLPGNNDWFVGTNLGADAVITEFLLASGTVGIKEHAVQENALKIYPNPSSGSLTLWTAPFIGKEMELGLFSIIGNQIYSDKFKVEGNEKNLNFSTLATGIYILNVVVDEQSFSYKLIKQ